MTHVSEAQKAALDVEVAAKEQLREALDECKQQAKREKMLQLTQVLIDSVHTSALHGLTALMENLEMSGNLAAFREIHAIAQKSGNCLGKILSAKTVYC